ncbi:MAG: hypothetical protein AAF253_14415, partial [Pseudomonadota bacterium]
NFDFRLRHVNILKAGYALEGLDGIISAYMALERGGISPGDMPDAEATRKKIESFLKEAYSKLGTIKGIVETTDWVVRMYGATALVASAHAGRLVGFQSSE